MAVARILPDDTADALEAVAPPQLDSAAETSSSGAISPGARRSSSEGGRTRFRAFPWSPWAVLPKRVTALGLGRECQTVARWAAEVAQAAGADVMTAVHLGRDRGAAETGLRRDVVARALQHLRACGLICLVSPGGGRNHAHGWALGGCGHWAPRPGYRPRETDSTTDSTTDSRADSRNGLHNGLQSGLRVESLSPQGVPREPTRACAREAAHGAAELEEEPAALCRGDRPSPPASAAPAARPAADAPPGFREWVGGGELELGCACVLDRRGGFVIVLAPCEAHRERT